MAEHGSQLPQRNPFYRFEEPINSAQRLCRIRRGIRLLTQNQQKLPPERHAEVDLCATIELLAKNQKAGIRPVYFTTNGLRTFCSSWKPSGGVLNVVDTLVGRTSQTPPTPVFTERRFHSSAMPPIMMCK